MVLHCSDVILDYFKAHNCDSTLVHCFDCAAGFAKDGSTDVLKKSKMLKVSIKERLSIVSGTN
jgi:hypothetical protein